MKKLCAKQNRRAKQWEFRNQFARLRISQCSCEIGKAVAKIRNAKIRNAKLARLLRNWNWHCEIEVGIAKLALRNSQGLPTHCENFCFAFFSSDFQYMLQNLHKTSKIKARKIA